MTFYTDSRTSWNSGSLRLWPCLPNKSRRQWFCHIIGWWLLKIQTTNWDLSPVHTERVSARVDASNQTNVKDSKHSHRPRRRASSNLHTSNERCQFKLYIGYWTSNNNKWPKCPCLYRTPSPDDICAQWRHWQWRNWQWRNWQQDEYAYITCK